VANGGWLPQLQPASSKLHPRSQDRKILYCGDGLCMHYDTGGQKSKGKSRVFPVGLQIGGCRESVASIAPDGIDVSNITPDVLLLPEPNHLPLDQRSGSHIPTHHLFLELGRNALAPGRIPKNMFSPQVCEIGMQDLQRGGKETLSCAPGTADWDWGAGWRSAT
jgi:hypothetical protein